MFNLVEFDQSKIEWVDGFDVLKSFDEGAFVWVIETHEDAWDGVDERADIGKEKVDVIIACDDDDLPCCLDVAMFLEGEHIGRVGVHFEAAECVIEAIEGFRVWVNDDDVLTFGGGAVSDTASESTYADDDGFIFVCHSADYIPSFRRGKSPRAFMVSKTLVLGYFASISLYTFLVFFFFRFFQPFSAYSVRQYLMNSSVVSVK